MYNKNLISTSYTPEQIQQASSLVAGNSSQEQQPQAASQPTTSGFTVNDLENAADPQIRNFLLQARNMGYTDQQIERYVNNANVSGQLQKQYGTQDQMLSKSGPITENYGQYQPGVEVFSGGFTNGTGIGVPVGTGVAVPNGKWEVVDSYGGANYPGRIGDSTNSGYGNSVLVKNISTGEMLRFSHLSQAFVRPGQLLEGGTPIGATGETGNVTGPHLNLEYYDSNGKLGDVMQSGYSQYLPTQ